jgi:hypothetical protein
LESCGLWRTTAGSSAKREAARYKKGTEARVHVFGE